MLKDKKLYGTSTIGTKGQVVIPVDARADFDMKAGDRLYVVGSCESGIITLIKEEKLEKFIEKMNLHIEAFNKLKNQKD